MHKLLKKLLDKRGIKDISKATPEEKETFDKWKMILSDEELTLESIIEFCDNQIAVIEARWRKNPTAFEENSHLIPQHTVYKTLRNLITAPKAERESLEKYLQSLIDSPDG